MKRLTEVVHSSFLIIFHTFRLVCIFPFRSLFSIIDFRFWEHCISPIEMYYPTSSRSVMASCGSICHCGRLCWTLIIFQITHWMFAGFQWICWCAIRCWYRRCSIRMIMMVVITIFQWMCKLRIGWNWLTLFVVLKDQWKNTNWINENRDLCIGYLLIWFDLIHLLTGCLVVTAL